MDLERLPSGKLATNQLVMACGALVYNILRFVGQTCLVTSKGIIRLLRRQGLLPQKRPEYLKPKLSAESRHGFRS